MSELSCGTRFIGRNETLDLSRSLTRALLCKFERISRILLPAQCLPSPTPPPPGPTGVSRGFSTLRRRGPTRIPFARALRPSSPLRDRTSPPPPARAAALAPVRRRRSPRREFPYPAHRPPAIPHLRLESGRCLSSPSVPPARAPRLCGLHLVGGGVRRESLLVARAAEKERAHAKRQGAVEGDRVDNA